MKSSKSFGVFFVCILLTGCGPSAEEVAATYIAETAAAASPTPAPTVTPTPIPYDLTVQLTDEEGTFIEAVPVSIAEQNLIQTTDAKGETSWTDLQTDNVTIETRVQGFFPIEEQVMLERGPNNITIQLERDPFGLQLTNAVADGETLLFIEDFQDGDDGFESLVGDWQIIEADDDPGNQVIQINQKEASDLAKVTFGPDRILDSFIVEYKFRYLEIAPFTGSEWQSMGFDFWNRYSVGLYPVRGGMYQLIDRHVDPWQFPVQVKRYFQLGRWYTVRVEVESPEINLYLDGRRVARYRNLQEAVEGKNDLSGLYALPHLVGQIDDIVLKLPVP